MVELVHYEKKLTEDEYTEFEKLFSAKLPLSFKEHYIRINGGFLAEEDVENDLWGLPVGGFNPIKYGKVTIEQLVSDIESIENPDTGEEYQEGEYVPFAYDDGGHTIFISLKEGDYGHIYLYDCDGESFFQISEKFEKFISRLYKN
ncbi:SMI1 / KNR4 family protein [Vibrio aerogenes CECT 7868]|uniref:SMI1 / KNR4 family protein n=1 Tax=Vibrio aerogenes CECT 7868 TaxID=1216006 RepID=A0A1M6EYM3_9VIBR|nr:SMI1/KNR4 family protein [Vibrio aerogenes]SHI90525.1 SMI1 / KNR4 family protein [Vibrio aerogenes CECT 7868]